jgi:opacity protein-like surface antigen
VRTTPAARLVLALLITLAGLASDADAQSAEGLIAGGGAAATAINSGTDVALFGGVGYRFNRVVGFGIEVTFVPSLEPELPDLGEILRPAGVGRFPPVPVIDFDGDGGHALVFTTNVRLEIPTTARRFIPYVVGGGGVASVRERIRTSIAFQSIGWLDVSTFTASGASQPLEIARLVPSVVPDRSFSQTYESTITSLALTLGGGLSILATEHFSIDADLRYLGLFGTRDRHVGRFGASASYRF